MERAYALLDVKSFDDEQRLIEGIASTPTPDRIGDVLEPKGARFSLPMPLLWQHEQREPIGEVIEAQVTPAGIRIKARIATIAEPGALQTRVDEAWHSIKARLVRGLSVGWKAIESLPIRGSFGVRATKWDWAETSAVTVPMNLDATILSVKACAMPARKDRAMTTAERITALENSRAAKMGRMDALMAKAIEANVTVDGSEDQAEYDGLELDVKKLDGDLARHRTLEQLNVKAAVPVVSPVGSPIVRPAYSGAIQVKANVRPGTAWIRMVQAAAACKGNWMQAAEYATKWRDSTPEVELFIKAAVAAGTTTDATWAGPLAPYKPMQDEFIEFLRPATIVGRIPNLRKVPMLISVPSQTGGAAAQWVGEGAPKPVGALQFGSVTLGATKCAIIVVITDELAKNSTPDAETLIRTDLINAIAFLVDTEFTLPARAPVAGVSPGSVTNGVTPITSAGTSPSNGRTDIAAMISALVAAGLSAAQSVLIMSESNAAALSAALNPLGQSLFASLNINGGSALGIPVITSQAVASNVIMLHPPSILFADEGGVAIDVSREASLQMDSAPMNPPDATVVMTSLWQSNRVGIRAERTINWKKARAGCVQYTVQTYVP